MEVVILGTLLGDKLVEGALKISDERFIFKIFG